VVPEVSREGGSRGFKQDINSVEKPYLSTRAIGAVASVNVTNHIGG
jgi:hypothetical protein